MAMMDVDYKSKNEKNTSSSRLIQAVGGLIIETMNSIEAFYVQKMHELGPKERQFRARSLCMWRRITCLRGEFEEVEGPVRIAK